MLKPEEVAGRILQMTRPDWAGKLKKRCARLPADLRDATRRLADLEEDDSKRVRDWAERARRKAEAAAYLDTLDADARRKAFTAICPKLGGYIEACWQRMKRQPYRPHAPFRYPDNPAATLLARANWLEAIGTQLSRFDPDIVWVAEWAPHVTYNADGWSELLAAAIDAGGEEGERVFQTLIDSANGEHETGVMGRHVPRALLSASREDGWAFIEKLLLAAQRQEGLRQAILETVDRAHPEAFIRMLRLILGQNLVRFSSVVRAADVWLALRWDSSSAGVVHKAIEDALRFLEDDAARHAAVAAQKADEAYMALWATAFRNAEEAIPPAAKLLDHADVEMRFTGAWMLHLIDLPQAIRALLPALGDDDLRVVKLALMSLASVRSLLPLDDEGRTVLKPEVMGSEHPALAGESSGVFAKLESLLPRLPQKPTPLKPLLWPWLAFKVRRSEAADLIPPHLEPERWHKLLPYVATMSPFGRLRFLHTLDQCKEWPEGARELLLKLAGDPSGMVRERAVQLLKKLNLQPAEARQIEALLRRKPGDLRRGALTLLKSQADADALASADRLLAAKSKPQRLGGLELLRELAQAGRGVGGCRARAEAYAAQRGELDEAERTLLDPVLGADREAPTLANALGLMDPAKRTVPPCPRSRGTKLVTKAAIEILLALDDLVHAHRETPIEVETWEGKKQVLLGEASQLSAPRDPEDEPEAPAAFPLADLWQEWAAERPASLRDRDGFELVRAAVIAERIYSGKLTPEGDDDWLTEVGRINKGDIRLRYGGVVQGIADHLARENEPPGTAEFVLDAAETTLALIPHNVFKTLNRHLRRGGPWISWTWTAQAHHERRPQAWSDAQLRRLVELLLWIDRPVDARGRSLLRSRVPLPVDMIAHGLRLGVLNEHDAYDAMFAPDDNDPLGLGELLESGLAGHVDVVRAHGYPALRQLTGRRPDPAVKLCPRLGEVVRRLRQRILEVETARGEQPTVATELADALRSVPGVEWLGRLLRAMGETPFARSMEYGFGSSNRRTVFSRLIRICVPADDDTPESFAETMRAANIPDDRLIDLAVFAPQWARFVEHALGWGGFEDAVWWTHAHTRDSRWSVDHEVREQWEAEVAERTPLEARDLLEGAVDVGWFGRAYGRLGPKRWKRVYAAAKNASGGGGHKRAQLFADAMLGKVTKTELVRRIEHKRHKDAVMALGLLPLARGPRRGNDLLSRYNRMQEFIRTSRQFGQQRQASEKRAAEIGQANLARTAGYRDPLRLQWAMEARAVSDLAEGPLAVTVGERTIELSINDAGEPEVCARRDGRVLRSIPAAVKKDKRAKALLARRTDLRRQASRMRQSLEQMMCRRETIDGRELADLMAHPVMRPMLERLVFLGDGIRGYPREGGRLLIDHAGEAGPVKEDQPLRIAHPHDLLGAGDWPAWQSDCFAAERVQPFKQVFRELYVLTDAERADGTLSRRYAGHQVNPRQALALLGKRGWVARPEEGVRRVFHDLKLSAWVEFMEPFYTPAEVEGLTIENVRFSRAGEWQPIDLADAPPVVFSEVMRDLDLVVSVAHRGGVDPEASASTVEMRSDLLRESLAVLGVENVRIENQRALIDGALGQYTVHLGSAVTHLMPGGALFIVPVHSQHRGRLFLPFADDDPKTAEVMSKVLLLARDHEIKDPAILDQVRHMTARP